jgi:diaminohydroxyphosphoribosylaminopyrimidine deaminase/5-amino-6-(5-phosphoribosylamino)uracil reductase
MIDPSTIPSTNRAGSTSDERYMLRAFQLSLLGAGFTAPNPMVGAVIVHDDKIIGEGYHQIYGGPHAEVQAVNQTEEKNRALFPESTIYVSLEPCAHYGKTPPCADLIIHHRFKRVVVASADPFPEVAGKGIDRMIKAGIQVDWCNPHAAGDFINRRFFTYHTKNRPYVVLKWAQTKDHWLGWRSDKAAEQHVQLPRLMITGPLSQRVVHQWRAAEAAILVGAGTFLSDQPTLNVRFPVGAPQPIRLVADPLRQCLELPDFASATAAEIQSRKFIYRLDAPPEFATLQNNEDKGLEDHSLQKLLPYWLNILHQKNVLSLFVEGGKQLIQSFLDAQLFDEIRKLEANATALESFSLTERKNKADQTLLASDFQEKINRWGVAAPQLRSEVGANLKPENKLFTTAHDYLSAQMNFTPQQFTLKDTDWDVHLETYYA